jgi:hypothetical protein
MAESSTNKEMTGLDPRQASHQSGVRVTYPEVPLFDKCHGEPKGNDLLIRSQMGNASLIWHDPSEGPRGVIRDRAS